MAKKAVSKDQEEEILKLYRQGLSKKEIASLMGVAKYCVKRMIKKLRQLYNFDDRIEMINRHKTIPINHDQFQCIIGTLLGDGCLSTRSDGSVYYNTGHGIKQKDYSIYISKLLGVVWHERINKSAWKPNTKKYVVNYYNKYELLKIAEFVLKDGVKTVSKEWCDKIEPLGLACWFMDDGTSSYVKHSGEIKVSFSTESFTLPEVKLLCDMLLIKFGIYSTIRHHNGGGTGYNIGIRQISVNKFMGIIEPHVIECMRYKIKRRKTETSKTWHGKWVSEKQRNFMLENYDKLSSSKISNIIRVPASTIQNIQRQHFGKRQPPWHILHAKEILNYYIKSNGHAKETCDKFNIPASTLHFLRKKYHTKSFKRYNRLTKQQKENILLWHNDNIAVKEIAQKLNADVSTIYKIIRESK